MSKDVAELENEAKRLPPHERALLIHNLIASLDIEENMSTEEVWLEEAERRYQAFKLGKLTAKPAVEVYRQARSKIQ